MAHPFRLRAGACLFVFACAAHANITLPYLIADHMVVQRDLPVHIWGKAAPGENVIVAFRGAERRDTADQLGRWSVYLPPGGAGGPFVMTVRGRNAISIQDVLAGDVWVASGQSNMEWPLAWAGDAAAQIAAAKHPRIRLVHAMHKISDYPAGDLVGAMWRECTPESARDFSAVAYHFGRMIQERTGAPVGLIQTAWGGTPLEAWTSGNALTADAAFMPVFAEWDQQMQRHPEELLRYDVAAKEWEKAAALAKAQHKPLDPPPQKPEGPNAPSRPGGLFNAMVAPITPFAIRGVIWYQGEANGYRTRAAFYGRLFQAMIRDWRRAWGIGDFPFLFAQLANYTTAAEDSAWPEVREAQRQALALRNTAMAVTIDIGTPGNIHPPDKVTVGKRLSLAARALAYGENIEYSGPLPRAVTAESGALRVWFDHAEGLAARGGALAAFEIAGADGKYAPATATIDGATVVVRSEAVGAPVHVRHGWADNPACNLFNAAGLPASPFRWE
jgi:sialate O-acetylesterase